MGRKCDPIFVVGNCSVQSKRCRARGVRNICMRVWGDKERERVITERVGKCKGGKSASARKQLIPIKGKGSYA